jgi:pyruvate dehydrogenase E2 component (dihydrolipoamide acetyltransferase)
VTAAKPASRGKDRSGARGRRSRGACGRCPGGGPCPGSDGTRIFARIPLPARIAAQKGLDLSGVAGSGPHGRIVRADVEAAKPAAVAAPAHRRRLCPQAAPVAAAVRRRMR